MRFELYISDELRGEMAFPNFRMDGLTDKKPFNKRKALIASYLKTFKRTFLLGDKAEQPYEIYLVHESRVCWIKKEMKAKGTKVGVKRRDKVVRGVFACPERQIGALMALKSIFVKFK